MSTPTSGPRSRPSARRPTSASRPRPAPAASRPPRRATAADPEPAVARLPDPRTSDAIDIDAPAGLVWSVYSDVARWPEWTASVTSVELSPDAPLAVGSTARIKQPRLPNVEWTVTTLEWGREWV